MLGRPRVGLVVTASLFVACGRVDDEPQALTSLKVTGGAAFSLQVERDGVAVGATSSNPLCPPIVVGLRRDSDDGSQWIDISHALAAPPAVDDVDLLRAGAARVVRDAGGNLIVEVSLNDDDGVARGVARVVEGARREGFVDVDISVVSDEFGDADIAFVGACFGLADDEHAVGGGERFQGPDLRGTVTPLVFSAPEPTASGTNEAHVPVPFLATTRGLGLYVESERVGAFDVGNSVDGALQVRFLGPSLPLRLRAGASTEGAASTERISDNVKAHARLLGLPRPPPRWALAPMQWRNDLETSSDAAGNLTSTGTDMLNGDVDEILARALPFSTVWIDAPWETGYNTFVVNDVQLPAFTEALQRLDDNGMHALVWATEHINTSDDSDQAVGMPAFASRALFERFRDEGFLVLEDSGAPFTFPWGRGQGAFVDFTNDAACDAWVENMRPLLERGIRGFKLDYGESMRPDLLGLFENSLPVFADGSTTQTQHTRYARLYHECYIRGLESVHGDDWFIITRTGGVFDQKNGVAIWPGDIDADFQRFGDNDDGSGDFAVGGLPSGIGAYLSLAMSGYPLYGADIGGYRGDRVTAEAFARFAEFSSLSTIFQVGGGSNQAPWDTDLDVVAEEFAAAARLKMSLWPMFETWIARASKGGDGTPVVVPLGVFMSGDDSVDEAAWADRDAFVVGDVLAAFPVVVDGARSRAVRVPQGRWFGLRDGRAVAGPTTAVVPAPLGEMPMFLRAGAVLVLDDESSTLLPVAAAVADNGERTSLSLHRAVVVAPGHDEGEDHVVSAGGLVVHQQSRTIDGRTTSTVIISGPAGPLDVVFLEGASVAVEGGVLEEVEDEEGNAGRVTRVAVDSSGDVVITFDF